VVGDSVLDGPEDVCGPGQAFVDLSGEVGPGEVAEGEDVAELGGRWGTLRGRRVEGWFMVNICNKIK
jgi:hypothetical protein